MANRREVLQVGLAISVAPLFDAAALLFPGALPVDRLDSSSLVDGIVLDNRFIESVEAAHSTPRGLALYEVDGDVTDLWYRCLDARWRDRPGALAGITGEDVLFVLENLASDRRLGMAYRGYHAPPREGTVRHTLSGPATFVDGVAAAIGIDGWSHFVGIGLAGWSSRRELAKTVTVRTTERGPSERRASLMSWVVVPSSWGMERV
jgi:hypothetical protein